MCMVLYMHGEMGAKISYCVHAHDIRRIFNFGFCKLMCKQNTIFEVHSSGRILIHKSNKD